MYDRNNHSSTVSKLMTVSKKHDEDTGTKDNLFSLLCHLAEYAIERVHDDKECTLCDRWVGTHSDGHADDCVIVKIDTLLSEVVG